MEIDNKNSAGTKTVKCDIREMSWRVFVSLKTVKSYEAAKTELTPCKFKGSDDRWYCMTTWGVMFIPQVPDRIIVGKNIQ